jgi:PTS system beta-glucosides-specific IIC component
MVINKNIIHSPVNGTIKPIQNCSDAMFAQQMLGESVLITPSNNEIYAPFDGEICMLFETKHAIGIRNDNNIELLIHIGVNTVNLGGKFFTSLKKQGEKVLRGDKILSVDFESINDEGYDSDVIVIITGNPAKYNYKKVDCNQIVTNKVPIFE